MELIFNSKNWKLREIAHTTGISRLLIQNLNGKWLILRAIPGIQMEKFTEVENMLET